MAELKGSLASLGLPAIVQLIGELHHSGNLELTRREARAVLGFNDGRLVAATYGQRRGVRALAGCCVELAEADFVFVEGVPADEPTMDLGGSELQTHIRKLLNGELTPESLESQAARADDTPALGICPLLGFVDDESRHYTRPTAMHRCFSAGSPSLVSGETQRELCLSGRYPTCPRYRNAAPSKSGATPVAASAPPARVSPPGMPAGVAARMAAGAQMHMATPDAADEVPDGIGPRDRQPSADSTPVEPGATRFGLRRPRGLVLVAIGAVLGLLVLVLGVLLFRPTLNGAVAQKSPTSIAQPIEPAPTLAGVVANVASVASPTAVPNPTLGPTATLAPRQATPTTATVAPTASVALAAGQSPTATAAGQPLIDVRLASGPRPGWLDNPPYASWSDGAYRLQAQQAAHFVAVSVPTDRALGDVVVSATFRKTGGPPGGGYGLVVRSQGPDSLDGVNQQASFYVMETGDLGDIGIWRHDADHWVDLVPWEHSDSVRVGGSPNELVARAIGDRLTFMVNQTEVASVQDPTLGAGGVGVFVGGDYNEVALDRFVVQAPD